MTPTTKKNLQAKNIKTQKQLEKLTTRTLVQKNFYFLKIFIQKIKLLSTVMKSLNIKEQNTRGNPAYGRSQINSIKKPKGIKQ